MTQLIIAGLILLCLLSVGIVAYLARSLARLRREQPSTVLPSSSVATTVPITVADTAAAVAHAGKPTITPTGNHDGAPAVSNGAAESDALTEPNSPAESASSSPPPPPGDAAAPDETSVPTDTEQTAPDETDVDALAHALDAHYQQSSRPAELREHAYFRRGVALLTDTKYSNRELIAIARGSNVVAACLALDALAARGSDNDSGDDAAARAADDAEVVSLLLTHINEFYYWPGYFALNALHERAAARPVLAPALLQLKGAWGEYTPLQSLREFVVRRAGSGEIESSFGDALHTLSAEQIVLLTTVFDELRDVLPVGLVNEFERWKDSRVDLDFLRSFGRVWEFDVEAVVVGADDESDSDGGEVVLLDAVRARVSEMETALRKEPPRSVMLVGESGTGKTALVRVLAKRLQRERWTIFEASAGDVLAGQKYIGELEGRVQTLVREIGGKRVLWLVPNFHEMVWAGRHQYNPAGLLDLLLPHIESGQVKLIGETPAAAYEKLLQLRPKLRLALETCRVHPLGDAETLEIAERWAERRKTTNTTAAPRVSADTLREAFQLAKQYLADKAAPGNLLVLLDSTHRRLLIERGASSAVSTDEITLDDLFVTLSQLTGLPASMLDDREGLDLPELRGFFAACVLGQPEAVECLVERVAMIKAGLTDPTRPQGVFLFVGPTGTGKTEIAKTLAEFLFGSPERMIRLDMSEFQTPDSLDRILGEQSDTGDGVALVNSIRKQPFSVVLLDEFEKAHPQVWDLFLQVFDDGRLTDRRGNTADFRHCIIIMTSNLGATLPHGASIGFAQEQAQFASGAVERAVGRAFRREFVNRIDRVVVFRPLGRSIMRDLLRKELSDVLRRRGLRTRQWAVEWDESAIDFLLERGFTADLGARPLKRAIERYLLSPLALTIVNHQFPEGDQFLFVRARTGQVALDVEFIDPDAPDESTTLADDGLDSSDAGTRTDEGGEVEPRLETIILDARGTLAEVIFLQDRFDALADQVDAEHWHNRKNGALLETSAPGFWDSPARFGVLGLAEYMDRIETGLDTAGSLLKRLTGSRARGGDRQHFPADLGARLAQQLYLMDAASRGLAAGHPRDAFLQVRAVCDAGEGLALCNDFARRIAGMYRGWAEARRMRFETLEEINGDADNHATQDSRAPYHMLAAVSGFAAYSLLRDEAGWHVLETPQEDDKSFNRARVEVRLVAQPDEPAGREPNAVRKQAARALAEDETNIPPQIVRRYREEPSPLVRDSVRGWRTGKLERILAGDFDLMF